MSHTVNGNQAISFTHGVYCLQIVISPAVRSIEHRWILSTAIIHSAH